MAECNELRKSKAVALARIAELETNKEVADYEHQEQAQCILAEFETFEEEKSQTQAELAGLKAETERQRVELEHYKCGLQTFIRL